jgi:hypothetical protein
MPRRASFLLIGSALAACTIVAQPAVATRAATHANPAQPFAQGCLGSPAVSGDVHIAWRQLRNPILSYPDSAVRDIGIRAARGRWHLLYTSDVGSAPTWRIASTTSHDLTHWSAQTVWPPQQGVAGVASPDITQEPNGTYVATYESNPIETNPPGQDKIYYRTSTDLVTWSLPHRLMPTIHSSPNERLIDPALAWTHNGLFLGYKFGDKNGAQHFEIAWSPSSSLDGPWTFVGRPDIRVYHDTIENYEFLQIDGRWRLLATSNTADRPWFFTLRGDPAHPKGWLNWSHGREFEVPLEKWNRAVGLPGVTFDQENSAYLCDARRIDGNFYLFYIGSTELKSYGGWGHTELGVARSKDLVSWQVPCGRHQVSTPIGCLGSIGAVSR